MASKLSEEKLSMADDEVIKRVLEGHQDLYEVLIRRYNGYLYKVGRSYGYEHDDVEDLMQDTYINAYRNLRSFEGRSTVKTWLVRIMLNQCYHKKQKFSYKYEQSTSEEMLNDAKTFFNSSESDVNKEFQNKELKGVLEAAILKLPEDYRQVFTLREMTGLSTAETAESLKISESNVKVRLNRAKKILQELVQQTYNPKELFDFNLIYCDGMVAGVYTRLVNENITFIEMPKKTFVQRLLFWQN